MSTAEPEELLADPELDAVIISVPDAAQAGLVLAAIAAGKQVYVEKPVAGEKAVFARLIRARDTAGCRVAVGFNKRRAPAYRAAHRHIIAMGGARSLFLRMTDDAWRWAADLPQGSLLRHDACHLFDLAQWLSESPIRQVMASGGLPDEHAALLHHESGLTSAILLSGNASMDFPKERMEAVTPHGCVTMDDFVEVRTFGDPGQSFVETFPGLAARQADCPWVAKLGTRGLPGMLELRRELHRQWRQSGKPVPDVIPNFLRDQGWRDSIREFLACIAHNKPLPHATLEDASTAAAVTWAVEQSRASGRAVSPADW